MREICTSALSRRGHLQQDAPTPIPTARRRGLIGPNPNGCISIGPTCGSSPRMNGGARTRGSMVPAPASTRRPGARSRTSPTQGCRLLAPALRLLAARNGGSVGVLDRRRCGCIAYHKRGTTVCRNALKVPIDRLEHAFHRDDEKRGLHPDIVGESIGMRSCGGPPRERISPGVGATSRKSIQRSARLTEAIATGGQLTPLDALKARQTRRAALADEMPRTRAIDVARIDRRRIDQKARRCVANWRARLEGSVSDSRQVLERSSSVQSS